MNISAALLLVSALALPASQKAAPISSSASVEFALADFQSAPAQAKKREHLKHFNLGKKSLAIQGYDPVAYFPEGGGKAKKGKKELSHTHMQVTYNFASKANLELFKKTPSKFEPAYGGWCAYAMADADKTDIDPKTFIIQDGTLHLFYNGFWGNTRKSWVKDPKGLKAKANKGWVKVTSKK